MELTFVHQYSGESPKRRRLAKACEQCRNRKKRCIHFNTATSSTRSRRTSTNNDTTNGDTTTTRPDSSSTTRRRAKFVSDLNPESILLQRPLPTTPARPNDDIGVWVDRSTWDALIAQQKPSTPSASSHPLQRPHSTTLGPLIDIYFRTLHPLLPILSEPDFRSAHAAGLIPEPLVHAICLLAAKDPSATPHLCLSPSTPPLPPRQYCTLLHTSITAALRVPARYDKTTLIRLLALTSLHTEGPDGAEEASLFLSQALHHAQTLGIHLGHHAPADAHLKRLFWCLWSLDRVSAATNGRPIIMSDVDIAIEPFLPGESGFPAFELWLQICSILNKVISFYRPTHDLTPEATSWEGDWPVLEELIDTHAGWSLPAPTLATLHLFYLTVGILSHRTRGVKELPSAKVSNLRQRLNAIEIIRLMRTSPPLLPHPLLPYAISLALSVSYQWLRQAQMPHQQEDAREDFKTCVQVLQGLRRVWGSADVMTTLARRVLVQVEGVGDLAEFRVRRGGGRGEIPAPTACVGIDHREEEEEEGEGEGEEEAEGDDEGKGEGEVNGQGGDDGVVAATVQDGVDLFDNMDDVFYTFMDPNYPLNLDDFSFVDDLTPLDWNADAAVG